MEILNDERFIKGVEKLIRPMQVSNLLFLQSLRKILPGSVLRRLLNRASRRAPLIGFVIEPYSLFLFFKLKDTERAKSLLPDRYELAKARIFADDAPDYYLGIGNLSTRASTFWGVRAESYLIARDRKTGLLCWIFIDILSDTIIALPSKGIADPNCSRAVFTTSSKGEVFLDLTEDRTGRRLAVTGNVDAGERRALDHELWVMGNTSIGHSRNLADGDDEPFAVIFDPAEVHEGLDIPPEYVNVTENTLFPDLAEPDLLKVVCFPYAQHYIADSPGRHTFVRDRNELVRIYNELGDLQDLRTFSGRTIAVQLAVGLGISIAVAVFLVIMLRS